MKYQIKRFIYENYGIKYKGRINNQKIKTFFSSSYDKKKSAIRSKNFKLLTNFSEKILLLKFSYKTRAKFDAF